MEKIRLSEHLQVKVVSEEANKGVFEIEGLYTGYGLTLGNALRRVLFSSLVGTAITQVKIKGVGHEFTALEGIKEDVVEIMLNLKKVRLAYSIGFSEYEKPEIIKLKAKGEGPVTAAAIEETNLIKVINPDQPIATITKKGVELEMELIVEKGLGYVPVEALKTEALPVGTIQLDALFSPVRKVNFTVENMRVGERTDFNRLRIVVETDGSLTPAAAMRKASSILEDHFAKIYQQIAALAPETPATPASATEEEKPKKRGRKKKASE